MNDFYDPNRPDGENASAENEKPRRQNEFESLNHADSMRTVPTYREAETERFDGRYDARAPRSNSPGKVLLITVAVLLCMTLCIGGGILGGIYAWRNTEPTAAVPENTSNDKTPAGEQKTGQEARPIGTVDEGNRNPAPAISKDAPIGDVTWSGSAGDDAYATLTEAIAQVSASVVEISTEKRVSGGWLGDYITGGAGSGVIISADGYIVTNNHVISGAYTITVRLTNGNSYAAKLIGTDEESDIAVIWIDTEETLSAARLGCSDDLLVGESVFAIGNPLGSLGGTVTNGIISATARDIVIDGREMTLLQTNAAVNPGNSGGGLFNMAGQLVGVVNAKCSEDDVEGLGFAIPIDTAYHVVCELIEYGYVRGVVDTGLTLYDISSPVYAQYYFGSKRTGTFIIESKYSAKILEGDLLLSIDGVAVSTGAQAEKIFREYQVGDTVTLGIYRGGKEITVDLTLREYVPSGVEVRFDDAG